MEEDKVAFWIQRLRQPRWYGRWGIRARAAEELGRSGDSRAVEPLLAALYEGDPATRQAAARSLGQLGDRQAVEGLLAALHDPWWNVRAAACRSLAQLNDRRAWEPLLVHLLEVMQFTAEFRGSLLAVQETEVFQALLHIEPGNLDQIQTVALVPADYSTWLAAVLWSRRGRAALPSLERSLVHDNMRVRKAAAQAFGLLAQPDSIPALADRLVHDEAYSVRKAAAEALAAIGAESEAALAAALQHEDWEIRQLARTALRQIASDSAADRLSNRSLSLVEVEDTPVDTTGRELAEARGTAAEKTGRELELREEPRLRKT
jgi:HEAT repeat protein